MGCSSSKETVEAPSTGAVGGKSNPVLSSDSHNQSKQHEVQPVNTVENDLNDNASTEKPEPGAPKTGADSAAIPLNDSISTPQGSPIGNRSRFLSYASGASTPNTSQGNLSWDGSTELDDDASGVLSASGDGEKRKGNPKSLKHSGSAIGLDDMRKEGDTLTSKVVHIEVPFGKPIEEVYDGVHDGPVLGSGVSGLVRLVKHKATGVKYAVKCLDLGLVGTKEGLTQLREEIFIMCQLDHPNIVRLEEVYESHSEIYLVQELCLGGELFDRLDEQPDYHYTEAECARLVKQMLSAVRYL